MAQAITHAIYEDDYGRWYFGQASKNEDFRNVLLRNARQIFPTLKFSATFAAGLAENYEVGPVVPTVELRTVRTCFTVADAIAKKIYSRSTEGKN